MSASKRVPIGYVVATVKVPIYAGDKTDDRTWDGFVYEEPGITDKGTLAVARRNCEVSDAKYFPL